MATVTKNTTFIGAFKCSKCGSFVKERLQLKHRAAFKGKVKNKTVVCYECKK